MIPPEYRASHGISTIALAGGHAEDKTLIMQRISEEIPDTLCASKPLATTILETGEYDSADKEKLLQASVDALHDLEGTMFREARKSGKHLIVYDTGNTYGNAAYATPTTIRWWTDTEWATRVADIQRMEQIMGESTRMMFRRYDKVVTLPYYFAVDHPTNARMSQVTKDFWTPHPNKFEIDPLPRMGRRENSRVTIDSVLRGIIGKYALRQEAIEPPSPKPELPPNVIPFRRKQ